MLREELAALKETVEAGEVRMSVPAWSSCPSALYSAFLHPVLSPGTNTNRSARSAVQSW